MLRVKDLMTVQPYTVLADASLREVLMRMKVEELRQIPVIDPQDNLIGIITDRDVRIAMNSPFVGEQWLDNNVLDNTTVGMCMTASLVTVKPDTPAVEAADMLSTYKFGGLPVVEGQQLIGIITISNILDHFVRENKIELDVA